MASSVKGRQRGGKPKRGWRIGGWRISTIAGAIFLVACFAAGFYLAQVYSEISALIEQRRAALTSAIYSAPTMVRRGDDINHLALADRLNHLSYLPSTAATVPGEYSQSRGAMTIYVRGFKVGTTEYAATVVKM